MGHIKKSIILVVVINLTPFIHPVRAISEPAAVQAEARLQQVALFKNGLGFFVSEATIPKKRDSFYIVPFAAASHGTFWVSYPPKVKLTALTVKEIDSEKWVDAVTIPEMLKANIGSNVRLWFSDEEDSTVEGIIKYFAEDRERPAPSPYAPGMIPAATIRRDEIFARPRLMIIETDEAEVCINPENVRRVEFRSGKAEKTFAEKDKSVRLDVEMAASAGGKKLMVSYLAKGITWAPSYIVDITDGEKAQLSAKAVVINEVCDLDDVTIQLVTGFPHLQFADVVSPLAKKENLAQFLQSLTRGQGEGDRLRGLAVVTQQRAMYDVRPLSSAEAIMPVYGTAEAGKVAEDLFLYPVEKVHLAKGEVGYFPLFTESVPYKHIYKWEIPDYVNEDERYIYGYDRRRQQQRQREEEVWHCLRMDNTTKVPWTTAPAETVKEGLILGQDTLNYTPAKGETTLRITRAVSVKAEQSELEIDRKRDAAQLYGYHYDLVTVQGKLSVTNFQPKPVTLEITKTLSGEVKSSQPQAESRKLARGLRRMNGVVELTWTIELEPGEDKQLDYIYDVYIRR